MNDQSFKTLYESLPIAVVQGYWRKSFEVLSANPAAVDLFKAKDVKEFQKGFSLLFLKVPNNVLLEILSERLKNGIVEAEFRLPTFKKTSVYLWMRMSFVTGQDVQQVILVFSDISRQKKVEQSLSKLAHIDGLTQVLNQRTILQRLDEELLRAKRYGLHLSCIIFDLDSFKDINDTFGHLKGDMCLKKAAQCLKQVLRKTDIVGRYGGDEFLVILPETASEQAVIAVRRIMSVYAKRALVKVKNKSLRTSFSIGISGYPAKGIISVKHLIIAADKALYLSKTSGGNMFHLANTKKA